MPDPHPTDIDLDSAIQLLVNEGERDPLRITRRLLEEYGEAWAKSEVSERAPQLIELLARMMVRHLRPVTNQLVLHPGQSLSPQRLHVYEFWVPGEGRKPASEITVADLRARAEFHRKLAASSMQAAKWCEDSIRIMNAQGVHVLGDVDGPLPPLPTGESLGELLA